MPRPLGYAKRCKKEYSPGQESEYIRCVLEKAHYYATRYPIGDDKDVVARATEAMVRLQTRTQEGVLGQTILAEAKFISYRNPNSHGLWPWLEEFGGLPVVRKIPGRRYLIDEQWFSALRSYFEV